MRTTKPGLFEAGPALEAVAIADGVAQAGQWGRHADRADLPVGAGRCAPLWQESRPDSSSFPWAFHNGNSESHQLSSPTE